MEEKIFEERLIVSKELFYNDENKYGAYGFKFKGKPNPIIKVHEIYRNFSIAGNIQQLSEGNE